MKSYLFGFLFSFIVLNTVAQDSNWSLDISEYQYSMTITAFLNVNGTTLSSNQDKVAAFVNGEIRGVANVVYVSSFNKYVAYLSIYSNTNGETINFKLYNSLNQEVVTVLKTETFAIDSNLGGIFQSYSIASPALSNQANVNSFSFLGVTSVSENITTNRVAVVVPSGTDISQLKPVFSISDGARLFIGNTLQVSGVSTQNFTNTVRYQILSEDESKLIEFDVNVSLDSPSIDAPVPIFSTASNFYVKQAPVTISLQTNVAIMGLTNNSFNLVNCLISSILKTDDLNYTVKIIPIQQGGFSIELPANRVFNNDGKPNLFLNKLFFIYDIVKPYIVSTKRADPINELTDNNTVVFTVTFSEAVDNVSSNDFDSISSAIVNVSKQTDAIYTIALSNLGNFVGVVSVNLKNTNTIQDKSGNELIGTVINVHQN